MGTYARGWWKPQNWGLFRFAAWAASTLMVVYLLHSVGSDAGLPDGVRALAIIADFVVAAISITVTARFFNVWVQKKIREKE